MKNTSTWQEARDRTVQLWSDIRASLGRAHPTDLLTDINLICPLCERAEAEREDLQQPSTDRCAFCIAYSQAGGCRQVCAEISTRVAERDWEAAREIADRFIETLADLELPAGDSGKE